MHAQRYSSYSRTSGRHGGRSRLLGRPGGPLEGDAQLFQERNQEKFKQHVRSRIALIRSGKYQETFGVPGVIVSYGTTGQSPEYRATRVRTMNAWTREVLAELSLQNWGGIFRFTAVEFDNLYDQAASLFEEPVWLRPDTKDTVRLFE